MRRRTGWAAGLLLALALGATPAAAHTALQDAEPDPGASLPASSLPDEIRLNFTDALQPGSTFTLYGEGFRQVSGVEGGIDPAAPDQLVAPMPPLEPGDYAVNWTAIGPDGDEVTGSYGFTVRGGSPTVVWAAAVVLAAIGLGFVTSRLRRRAG